MARLLNKLQRSASQTARTCGDLSQWPMDHRVPGKHADEKSGKILPDTEGGKIPGLVGRNLT